MYFTPSVTSLIAIARFAAERLVRRVPNSSRVTFRRSQVSQAWEAWARACRLGQITTLIDGASLVGRVIHGPKPSKARTLTDTPMASSISLSPIVFAKVLSSKAQSVAEESESESENESEIVEVDTKILQVNSPPGLRTYATTTSTTKTKTVYFVPLDSPSCIFPLPHPEELQNGKPSRRNVPSTLFAPKGRN